jgi:hypothetical protein
MGAEMKPALPYPLCDEKPTENVFACRLCGADDEMSVNMARVYGRIVPGADVCGECAERVANAFHMGSRDKWMTYTNPAPLPPSKQKIPHKLRQAVYERDAYRCVKCGSHKDLSLDHIHPESKGGATTLKNLQTMCRPCNSSKGVKI